MNLMDRYIYNFRYRIDTFQGWTCEDGEWDNKMFFMFETIHSIASVYLGPHCLNDSEYEISPSRNVLTIHTKRGGAYLSIAYLGRHRKI
jgi:hypothetical protein